MNVSMVSLESIHGPMAVAATQPPRPVPPATEQPSVHEGHFQILCAEPNRSYLSLGRFSLDHQTHGHAPNLAMAMPVLFERALKTGADAIILRGAMANAPADLLQLEGEAIRWK